MLGESSTLGIEASCPGEGLQRTGEVTHGLGVPREDLEVVFESVGDRHEGPLVIPTELDDRAVDSRHGAEGLFVDVGEVFDHGP